MDNIQQLTSDYLDNELSDAEAAQLASALKADIALTDKFVLDNVVHSQLLDLMNHKRLQDRVIGEALAEAGEPLPRPLSTAFEKSPRPRLRSRILTWGAIAATLLVAVSILSVAYEAWSRPAYMGTLTDASNARWRAAPTGFGVGAFLREGQELELVSGTAVVTCSNGAKLYMEGPTTLRLDSPKDVQLTSGRIAAKVPRPAVDFTVHTSLAEFVDLGTEFTLQLDAEKTFQLHVFEGLVEVRLNERFGKAAQRPARIAEVFAVTFDVKSGDIDKFPFEEGKKMPF